MRVLYKSVYEIGKNRVFLLRNHMSGLPRPILIARVLEAREDLLALLAGKLEDLKVGPFKTKLRKLIKDLRWLDLEEEFLIPLKNLEKFKIKNRKPEFKERAIVELVIFQHEYESFSDGKSV